MHPLNTVIKIRRISHVNWLMRLVYLPILLLAMPTFAQAANGVVTLAKIGEPVDYFDLTEKDRVRSENHRHLLYMLLVGEIAANRDLPNEALAHYVEAAKLSVDPLIAQQTTQWAIQFQSPASAIIGAELWAQNAPNDLQAQMVITTLIIGQSIQKAIPYLIRALEIAPLEFNQHIVSIQSKLSEKSAGHLKMALQLIAKERPENADAQLAAAQTSASLGDFKNANLLLDKGLILKPNFTQALELKARLIRNEDETDTRALKFLSDKVATFSTNAELRLFYASALLDACRFEEAKTHLILLTADKAFGGQALIFLGEIYINDSDFKSAAHTLKQALAYPSNRDNAQYLLGEIAEYQNKNTDAIKWYSEIDPGTYHILATLRAANLLKNSQEYDKAISLLRNASSTTIEEQKQLILSEADILLISNQHEDASALINEVLTKLPDDNDVLFSHALISIRLQQWSTAEHDLMSIIKADVNHADALNALGYLYSLQKERQQDARKYISQALTLSPNNPTYLDTMGWLEYRLGANQEALTYLLKARQYSIDAEIAAHLGEVLWITGNQQEAKLLFTQALKQNPNQEILKETMLRLKIDVHSREILSER